MGSGQKKEEYNKRGGRFTHLVEDPKKVRKQKKVFFPRQQHDNAMQLSNGRPHRGRTGEGRRDGMEKIKICVRVYVRIQ